MYGTSNLWRVNIAMLISEFDLGILLRKCDATDLERRMGT